MTDATRPSETVSTLEPTDAAYWNRYGGDRRYELHLAFTPRDMAHVLAWLAKEFPGADDLALVQALWAAVESFAKDDLGGLAMRYDRLLARGRDLRLTVESELESWTLQLLVEADLREDRGR